MNAREGSLAARQPAGTGDSPSRALIELLLLNAEMELASARDAAALEPLRQALSRLRDSLGSTAPSA